MAKMAESAMAVVLMPAWASLRAIRCPPYLGAPSATTTCTTLPCFRTGNAIQGEKQPSWIGQQAALEWLQINQVMASGSCITFALQGSLSELSRCIQVVAVETELLVKVINKHQLEYCSKQLAFLHPVIHANTWSPAVGSVQAGSKAVFDHCCNLYC